MYQGYQEEGKAPTLTFQKGCHLLEPWKNSLVRNTFGRAGAVAQVVECSPSTHEALGFTASTTGHNAT